MHPRSITARNDKARERIRAAAAALSDALGVPPLAQVTPVEWRTPGVGPMRELETIADALEGIAAALLTKEVSSDGR